MITRIELVNYMSHGHTVIEPAEGLTVLVGPNNCGKSAVADALRTVCGFNRGDYMVRHGERTASVTVETSEGHTVTWSRNRDTVSWKIDDREVHREMPDDLHEKLRLPLVSPEGSNHEFSVHIADQKQPLFLLGMPPSAPAVFFASASDARHFITMRQAHKQRTQTLKDERKRVLAELERVDKVLAILEPVPELETVLEGVEAACAHLNRALEDGELLRARCEALDAAGRVVRDLDREHAVLGRLQAPPTLVDTAPLEDLLRAMASERHTEGQQAAQVGALASLQAPPRLQPTEGLEALVQALELERRQEALASAQTQALQALKPIPALCDPSPLAQLCGQIRAGKDDARHLEARLRHLEGLIAPPRLSDPEPLGDLVNQIHAVRQRCEGEAARVRLLEGLREVPRPSDVAPLVSLLHEADTAASGLADLQQQQRALEAEHRALSQEIQDWLAQHGACPACGQALNEQVFIGGGAHGH